MSTTMVTALGVGPTGAAPAEISFTSDEEVIRVSIKTTEGTVTCRIADGGHVPNIQVHA